MISTESWPCAHLSRAPLNLKTTLKVGGEAEHLLEPADPEELRLAIQSARERGLPWRILGGGANLLIADGLIPGVTIATDRIRRTFRHHPEADLPPEAGLEGRAGDSFSDALPRSLHHDYNPEPRLVCWAGTTMPGLVNVAKSLGWSGLEGLAGVPGSIGGGVAMNAGGSWGELWDVVERVRVIDADGQFRDLERAQCNPGYRNGGLGEQVVAGVVLRLKPAKKADVEAEVRRYLEHKRAVQPVTEASAGCMFKNPDKELSGGRSAGQLLDQAGLKGTRIGGAEISPKHANFLVNRGGASGQDARRLLFQARDAVAQRFGLELGIEVKLWP
jgi:UDP-N-acetylmuramate dehydrogenase